MPVRVAVIGCGAIARRQHIPALRAAGAEFTVFASRTLASAQAARDDVGEGEVTTDWREAVRRTDVDAVTVCTPNALHAQVAIAAAEMGKHVLVEKPFALNLAAADAMLAAGDAGGVILMAAHNVRFAAPFALLRDAVASGAIGTVTSARFVFCHAGPENWAPGSAWFRDPDRSGGGALLDLGVHVVDALRFVLDDEISHVTATLDRLPIDEDAFVSFTTRNGVVGSFHAGWRSTTGPDHRVVIAGTDGTLVFDPATGVRLIRPEREPETLASTAPADDPCAAFLRAIEAGGPGVPSGHDGRAALAVVLAAYTAAATGRTQEVESA